MRGSESAMVTAVSKHTFAKEVKRNPTRSQTMHLFPSNCYEEEKKQC